MAPIREQAGTFADSIKLWSDTASGERPPEGAPTTARSAEVS